MKPICSCIIFEAIAIGYIYDSEEDDMEDSDMESDSGFIDDGDVTTEYSEDDYMEDLDEEDEMEADDINGDEVGNLADDDVVSAKAPGSVNENWGDDESDVDDVGVDSDEEKETGGEERNLPNETDMVQGAPDSANDNKNSVDGSGDNYVNDSDNDEEHEEECSYINGRCQRHRSPSLLDDMDEEMRDFLENEANPRRFRIRRSSSTFAIGNGPEDEIELIEIVDLVTSESEDEDSQT